MRFLNELTKARYCREDNDPRTNRRSTAKISGLEAEEVAD